MANYGGNRGVEDAQGRGLETLIPVINRLQDAFSLLNVQDPIDLPQIVVVGAQSSGKSSVLEHVVGRDFLPRGSGIVTRRPLVLQLLHVQENKSLPTDQQEWGEFLHIPGRKYFDFNEIRNEIERETERVTGRGKGISAKPINLKVFSPLIVNLTLVDLPGITKVPVGDQPGDIEKQIRRMVMEFIEKKNAIILAVTAANTDVANSDAIKFARVVDPEGNRTLGVLTKLDIMDKGTDASDQLLGRIIPLKLGFVGVINRSQEDINNSVPIRSAVEREASYFRNHPAYRSMASRLGTSFLSSRLNKLLLNHIRRTLPDLKNRIATMMSQTQTELLSYGDELLANASKGAILLQLISKFCADYREMIDGRAPDQPTQELYGGARIQYIFQDLFARGLLSIDGCKGLDTNDIRTAIRNATGPRPTLFVPESSFELLAKRQIAVLEEPSLQCVDYVFEELVKIVTQLEMKDLQRFHVLRERVVDVASGLLKKCLVPTNQMIQSLIQIELGYINTNHPDFVGGTGAISSLVDKLQGKEQNEEEGQASAPDKRSGSQAQAGRGRGTKPEPPKVEKPRNEPQPKGPPVEGDPAHTASFFKYFFGGKNGQGQKSPQSQTRSQQGQAGGAPIKGQPSRYEGDGQVLLDKVPNTLRADGSITDREMLETELIRTLLSSYFNIVRKNIMDSVPKAIMYLLVNQSRESLQHELVSKLYREELFDELLQENSQVAERRQQCQELIKVLRKASEIVNDVRDISGN